MQPAIHDALRAPKSAFGCQGAALSHPGSARMCVFRGALQRLVAQQAAGIERQRQRQIGIKAALTHFAIRMDLSLDT